MQTRKLVFNSDDFGYSSAFNEGIRRGYLSGVLTSTCILANGEAFDQAVDVVLPELENIGVGIHLNIIEGRSLTSQKMLTDSEGVFNNGFVQILQKSYNKEFIKQVEIESRAQIEKILSKTPVDHINSHVHTHAIPELFKLTCKLAKDYEISNIRTQYEKPYFVPNFHKHMRMKYPINLVKLVLLNNFSSINKDYLKKVGLNTNDYILGVSYTGYMDEDSVIYGLNAIKDESCLTEILIHPTYFEKTNIEKPLNYNEFLITQSDTIKSRIIGQNWELSNYKQMIPTLT